MKKNKKIFDQIREDGLLLKNVPKNEQTFDLCSVAIQQNPLALRYASRRIIDKDLCELAFERDPACFAFVPNKYKTDDMIGKAILSNALLLKNVPKESISKDLCLMALKENPMAIRYIPKDILTQKMCNDAFKDNVDCYQYIPDDYKNHSMTIEAVSKDNSLLVYVPHDLLDVDVCVIALRKSWYSIRFIPERLREQACSMLSDDELIDYYSTNSLFIEYFPERDFFVELCFQKMKEKFFCCYEFSKAIKNNITILQYQKGKNALTFEEKYYCGDVNRFICKCKVLYDRYPKRIGSDEMRDFYYQAEASFESFEKFYDFIDGDLSGAVLINAPLERIDLSKYNIKGALIDSDVLRKQGLFDDSFCRLVSNVVAKDSKIVLDNESNSLIAYEQKTDRDAYLFYYVSDLHLCHRVINEYGKYFSYEEAAYYVKQIAHELIDPLTEFYFNVYLLVAGDTSSSFLLFKEFYSELVKIQKAIKTIVIAGNHELWDPAIDYKDNLEAYENYFDGLKNVFFLQNSILYLDDDKKPKVIDPDEYTDLELMELIAGSPFSVLGGIGFSGLNKKYNASVISYGVSFDRLEERDRLKLERKETESFNSIYMRLLRIVPASRIIVLSHTSKDDWNDSSYNPNWIYVSGHTHHNYLEVTDNKKIYADNQIGYRRKKVGLKFFELNYEFDALANYGDGIHEITKKQYLDFNRGQNISVSFSRNDGTIYLVKKNGIQMFFIYCQYTDKTNNKRLYYLNGGRLKKGKYSEIEDLQYYYENLEKYCNNIKLLLKKYRQGQEIISDFIKSIGGIGTIHGCIIDVEKPDNPFQYSYRHIYYNPYDGTVTLYFAYDVSSRIVCKDFKTLIGLKRNINPISMKRIRQKYKKLLTQNKENLPEIKYSKNTELFRKNGTAFDEGGYIYKMSRIIRSLQYTLEKNVVRNWNEKILDDRFIDKLINPQNESMLLEDSLILEDIKE